MKCKIVHESGGRMRVHLNCVRMTLRQADVLEFYLRNIPGVTDVAVFNRTQDAVIRYRENRAAEGECVVQVDKETGGGRYDRIVKMIEESEKLKSTVEAEASHLADKLVPYTLGGTALTYLLTRNVTKTLAVLMVDFSCALKLAMPIAVLSAMRESALFHISVKGGRFLESMAAA